ncbi:MAG: NCS2 family permease [Lentisphaerae bacterium]|nr:NCS2 family permease [Lentisphaerota bacterium]
MISWLEKTFKIKENNTTVKREIYTGLVTFLAVSYILAVNPAILSSAGMDRGGVLCATAIAAFIGTLCMAFFANFPLLLAPGMGLNAFFAFTVVRTMGFSWQFALFAVIVEGLIFFLLSISSIREKIIEAIPMPLKNAMGAGVGLFITLIAFKNANIIRSHPDTLLTIQHFFGPDFPTVGISAILALTGVLITAYLMHRKVAGSMLIGILATWLLGMICQLLGIYRVIPEAGCYSLFPDFSGEAFRATFAGFGQIFGAAFDVDSWHCSTTGHHGWELVRSFDFAVICFSFLFADFFDTVGTINGAVVNTPLMKKDGTIPRLRGALLADSVATFAGGILGTSTVTTMAESATGVNVGARTGLAALTGAFLFLLSLIAAPIFMAIPGFATAPALIIVGFLMLRAVKNIDMDDIAGAVPAYLLICGMVFTYSISDGLGMGVIAWTLLNCGIKGRVNWLLWCISLLFIAKYIYL